MYLMLRIFLTGRITPSYLLGIGTFYLLRTSSRPDLYLPGTPTTANVTYRYFLLLFVVVVVAGNFMHLEFRQADWA